MYDITNVKISTANAGTILAEIRKDLPGKKVCLEDVSETTLHFTSPLLQRNCNLFAAASKGWVSVEQCDSHSVLTYGVSLFRARIGATLFTAASIVLPLSSGDMEALSHMVPMGVLVGWGWVYGMNYLLASIRVSHYFDSLLSKIQLELAEKCRGSGPAQGE